LNNSYSLNNNAVLQLSWERYQEYRENKKNCLLYYINQSTLSINTSDYQIDKDSADKLLEVSVTSIDISTVFVLFEFRLTSLFWIFITINCQIYKTNVLLLFEYKFICSKAISVVLTEFSSIETALAILDNYEISVISRNTVFDLSIEIQRAEIEQVQN